MENNKPKTFLDKFIKWGLVIFACFMFILIAFSAISDPDGTKSQQRTSDNAEKPKLSVEEQAKRAKALTVLITMLEDAEKRGSIIKHEITGVEDEIIYLYIKLATWKTATREEKTSLLATFGKQWVEAGGASLYFKDVMTDDDLGRWSFGQAQIY